MVSRFALMPASFLKPWIGILLGGREARAGGEVAGDEQARQALGVLQRRDDDPALVFRVEQVRPGGRGGLHRGLVVGDAEPGLQGSRPTCRPYGWRREPIRQGSAPWRRSADRAGFPLTARIITGSSICTTERYSEPLFFCIFSRLTSDLVPSKMIFSAPHSLEIRDDDLLDPGLAKEHQLNEVS